jgi:hypothetical protein
MGLSAMVERTRDCQPIFQGITLNLFAAGISESIDINRFTSLFMYGVVGLHFPCVDGLSAFPYHSQISTSLI